MTLEGGAAATHAERQSTIAQNDAGTNDPIGVSREQSGDCRGFFREHAENPERPGYPGCGSHPEHRVRSFADQYGLAG